MRNQDKYFVYFYYDKEGALLYIGKAIDVGSRWNGHNDPWKSEVCKIGVSPCPDHAAMDIWENYFIAKMPTKYNKAGTQHGYTSFEMSNLPQPTIYTLAEFKAKYIKNEVKPRTVYPPMEERIRAEGVEIIDVGARVNVAEYLDRDLDRVCFRYKNMYLFSRYSPVPGAYGRGNRGKKQTHVTNDAVRGILHYHDIPNKETVMRNSDWSSKVIREVVFETDEAGMQAADLMFCNFERLYDFYEVELYRPHHEVLRYLARHWFNSFGCLDVRPIADGFEVHLKQQLMPHLDFVPYTYEEGALIYDFEKAVKYREAEEAGLFFFV